MNLSRIRRALISIISILILALIAYSASSSVSNSTVIKGETTMVFHLTSPAFSTSAAIPTLYTCEGKDTSPALAWTDIPASTKSLALIVDDPDAPDPAAPKMTWVHWVLYNIPATTMALEANMTDLPTGALSGLNDWKKTGYGGPCPPIGTHRYFFKLYALDTVLSDLHQPTKAVLEKAMAGHILGQATLIGTYHKGKK